MISDFHFISHTVKRQFLSLSISRILFVILRFSQQSAADFKDIAAIFLWQYQMPIKWKTEIYYTCIFKQSLGKSIKNNSSLEKSL